MIDMIRVQPATRLRQQFARWATEQTPKIRTIAPHTFAVPAGLYVEAPEAVLIGALIDGHRYVSPDEEYGPDAVPLPQPDFAPLEDAPVDDGQDDDSDSAAESHMCDDCGRPYGTERGLTMHRRQKHREGA